MKKIILGLTVIFYQQAFTQQADIFKIKKYRVGNLNEKIEETSGLNFFDGKLYTFNDSGNTPELFEINKKTGEIVTSMVVDAKNTDWEALTNDGVNFYIGDFGNNRGMRQDLQIYKIPFKSGKLVNDSLKAISFYYPEQKDFNSNNLNTDFDAEAMIYLNGKVHVFTKEWSSKSTTHYIIDPNIYENQPAKKVETYKTNYVVTDAYYFDKKLYLVGYTKKTEVFLDIFNETEPGIFFQESPKHFYLGSSLSIGQIEGIAVDESGIYISGEKFNSPLGSTKPCFYFIPNNKIKL